MGATPPLLTASSDCPTYDSLRPREQAFIDAYLVTYRGDVAAIKAGYTEHSARKRAYKLLQRAEIRDAIRERMQAARASADDVLHVLTRQMWGSMEDLVSPGPDGTVVFDPAKVTARNAWPLVRKFKLTTRTIEGSDDEDPSVERRTEFELYSSKEAAELLARHHQILERHDANAPGQVSVVVLNVIAAARQDPGALASFVTFAAEAARAGRGPLPAGGGEDDG